MYDWLCSYIYFYFVYGDVYFDLGVFSVYDDFDMVVEVVLVVVDLGFIVIKFDFVGLYFVYDGY